MAMTLNFSGDFEKNRKTLNDALGIDHEEQNRQIESIYDWSNMVFIDMETGETYKPNEIEFITEGNGKSKNNTP